MLPGGLGGVGQLGLVRLSSLVGFIGLWPLVWRLNLVASTSFEAFFLVIDDIKRGTEFDYTIRREPLHGVSPHR
jgi:hypothetical protein